MDLTWLWFTAFVPRRRELISQSHPLPDTVRMHLSHCQQLVSLKPLVKSACYRFNIFKLPRSRRLEPSRGGKTKRGAPCATPRRALTINHGCQGSCAPALRRGELTPELYIIQSCDECAGLWLRCFWLEAAPSAGSIVTTANAVEIESHDGSGATRSWKCRDPGKWFCYFINEIRQHRFDHKARW